MVNMVMEPLAEGFSGVKVGKNGRVRKSGSRRTSTQRDLKNTGADPKTRDQMLLSQLNNLGLSVK